MPPWRTRLQSRSANTAHNLDGANGGQLPHLFGAQIMPRRTLDFGAWSFTSPVGIPVRPDHWLLGVLYLDPRLPVALGMMLRAVKSNPQR